MDKIARFLAYHGKINIVCASTTQLVEEARNIHGLSPLATAALGRTLTIGAMMGANLKEKAGSITLQVKGNGPIGGITVTADKEASVRGYVVNPTVDLPLRKDGKLNVGEAVGKDGSLYVIKDIGLKDPYVGMAKLVSGEIAEDFAHYFYTSEQKNTAVALGVLVNKDGVKASGGYLITAMPDATEEECFILENRIREAKPISQMLEENKSLLEIAKDLTGDENIQELQEKVQPKWKCPCSKEKMAKALITIGEKELQDIIEKEGKAELVCHFCNKTFSFTKEELEGLKEQAINKE